MMNILKFLQKKGFTKQDALQLIHDQKIIVDQKIVNDPTQEIDDHQKVQILPKKTWVSRGAYKLLKAIEAFKLDFTNKIVLDIGASTGGFTDVVLKKGAKKVYALDVGSNQLDFKLRQDPRVCVYEKTNLKTIKPAMFDHQIDIVVCDVSFISLKHVFDVLHQISHPQLKLVALIKPQFEAEKNQVQQGGFVANDYHPQILQKIHDYASNQGFKLIDIITSPILGKNAKNVEYLAYYQIK